MEIIIYTWRIVRARSFSCFPLYCIEYYLSSLLSNVYTDTLTHIIQLNAQNGGQQIPKLQALISSVWNECIETHITTVDKSKEAPNYHAIQIPNVG